MFSTNVVVFAGTGFIGDSTTVFLLFDCGVTFFVIVGGGFLRGGVTVANRIVLFAVVVVVIGMVAGFCGDTAGFSGVFFSSTTTFFSSACFFSSVLLLVALISTLVGAAVCDLFSTGLAGEGVVFSGDFSIGFVGIEDDVATTAAATVDDGGGCEVILRFIDGTELDKDDVDDDVGKFATGVEIGVVGLIGDEFVTLLLLLLLLLLPVAADEEEEEDVLEAVGVGPDGAKEGTCDVNCCWKFCN